MCKLCLLFVVLWGVELLTTKHHSKTRFSGGTDSRTGLPALRRASWAVYWIRSTFGTRICQRLSYCLHMVENTAFQSVCGLLTRKPSSKTCFSRKTTLRTVLVAFWAVWRASWAAYRVWWIQVQLGGLKSAFLENRTQIVQDKLKVGGLGLLVVSLCIKVIFTPTKPCKHKQRHESWRNCVSLLRVCVSTPEKSSQPKHKRQHSLTVRVHSHHLLLQIQSVLGLSPDLTWLSYF